MQNINSTLRFDHFIVSMFIFLKQKTFRPCDRLMAHPRCIYATTAGTDFGSLMTLNWVSGYENGWIRISLCICHIFSVTVMKRLALSLHSKKFSGLNLWHLLFTSRLVDFLWVLRFPQTV